MPSVWKLESVPSETRNAHRRPERPEALPWPSAMAPKSISPRIEPANPSILRQVLSLGSRMTLKRSIVFGSRSLIRPIATLRWLAFLGSFAREEALGRPHDDLVRKSLSTFLVRHGSTRTRLRWLIDHFRIAGDTMAFGVLRALWRGDAVEIGMVEGRSENYRLQIRLADHCGSRHEGAFTILLSRARDGYTLCMASFVFVRCGETSYAIVVGGMQGPRDGGGKRALVVATRCLGGLRPKDAVLLVLQGAAAAGGAVQMLAVSSENHVINLRRRKRRRMMHADLDHYWLERGGEPSGKFGFRLPIQPFFRVGGESRRDQSKLAFWTAGALVLSRPA